MYKIILSVLIILNAGSTFANDKFIFLGFGEIPIMSDSFKPSFGMGKKFPNSELGVYIQLDDSIERNDESFNAEFGQEGLSTSREEVGERLMLQYKHYPLENYFYFSLGLMYGGGDKESMTFDSRNRLVGTNYYNTNLNVTIERKAAVKPIVGLGLSYPLTKNFKILTDFTMDWFTGVADADISISSSASISSQDRAALKEDILDNFKSSFHNRYHVFNIGIQYDF